MLTNEIFQIFVYPTLVLFASSGITWIFARRKNNSEITGIDIDNAKEVIKLYKDFGHEMKLDAEKTRGILKEIQEINEKFQSRCIQPDKCKD